MGLKDTIKAFFQSFKEPKQQAPQETDYLFTESKTWEPPPPPKVILVTSCILSEVQRHRLAEELEAFMSDEDRASLFLTALPDARVFTVPRRDESTDPDRGIGCWVQ